MNENFTVDSTLAKKLKQFLKKELSAARYKHSLKVAELAQELSLRYALSPSDGYLAGLVHDLAREWEPLKLISYLHKNKGRMTKWERENPLLVHGKVAAFFLQNEFGLKKKNIIEAVRKHVVGYARMSKLAQILYVADYLEPGRKFLREVERQRILKLDLSEMLVAVAEQIISYLKKARRAIAPPAFKMLNYYRKKLKRGKP